MSDAGARGSGRGRPDPAAGSDPAPSGGTEADAAPGLAGRADDADGATCGSDPDSDGDVPDLYPRIVNRADYDPAFDPAAPIVCERCGALMHYTHNCRIVCDRCGYTRDCSDP